MTFLYFIVGSRKKYKCLFIKNDVDVDEIFVFYCRFNDSGGCLAL